MFYRQMTALSFWERFFKSNMYKSRKKATKEEEKSSKDTLFEPSAADRVKVETMRLVLVNPTVNLALSEADESRPVRQETNPSPW